MFEQSRRGFFKTVAAIGGLALLAPLSKVQAEEGRKKADGDLPLVEPGKDMAATVNYQHKGADVKDAKLKVDRQGTSFDKQSCSNCMLYAKKGMKDGAEVGACTIFPGKVVKGSGWCTSWNKKA
jgi:hypothetical protein